MKKQNYVFKIVQDSIPESPREWDNEGHMICAHKRYTLGDEQSSAPYDMCGYESNKENFLTWVFDRFIVPSETVPELLKGWYLWNDNTGQAVFCKDDNKNDNGNFILDAGVPKSFIKAIEGWMENNLAILPLFLMDHSGISISTEPFGCRWDSGQVGYIYTTKEVYEKNWSKPFDLAHAKECLVAEVETYDNYLTGEVYGKVLYRIEDEDFDPTGTVSLTEAKPTHNLYEADSGFDINMYKNQEIDACWGYFGNEYARQCALEEFPDTCLSDTLGDYYERYLVSKERLVSNGILETLLVSREVFTRERLIAWLKTLATEGIEYPQIEPFPEAQSTVTQALRYC